MGRWWMHTCSPYPRQPQDRSHWGKVMQQWFMANQFLLPVVIG